MNEVDTFVGRRIRARRIELGKTQAELADSVGVRFQQVQKYETGANRVSASRLWAIADILRVPVEYFFQEAEAARAEAPDEPDPGIWSDVRARRLMRNFHMLPELQKKAVLEIVKSMADEALETHDELSRGEA